MSDEEVGNLGFVYRVAKNGAVVISHHDKVAATLRGAKGAAFLKMMDRSTFFEQQQAMARITGNYKRGNEKVAKNHPRNK